VAAGFILKQSSNYKNIAILCQGAYNRPQVYFHKGAFVKRFKKKLFGLPSSLLLTTILFCGQVAKAKEAEKGVLIQDIEVRGTQRIAPETVKSYLAFKKGENVSFDKINESLKTLFSTELFVDISHTLKGHKLLIEVIENPIINRIGFEGNKKLKTDKLKSEIQARPRVVYTASKIQADVERLLTIYRHNGRFAVKIVPKIVKLAQNRVDLVFEIDEGPVTRVRKISFVGANKLRPSKLREMIKTKESSWFRIFSNDDVYDPHRLDYDKELLREFYLSKGYADFRVSSAVAELLPDKSGFFITFTVEEGQRYKVGDVSVESQLKELKSDAFKKLVEIKSGEQFNMTKVNNIVLEMTDMAGSSGYAFVDVKPKTTIHADRRVVDIRFEVGEGPKIHVERINVENNYKTRDHVIRRQFSLAEGDAFNVEKLKESKRNLENLGFFGKVEVDHNQGSNPDQAIITVNVDEKRTSEINFGGGYGDDGIAGRVQLKESNFLGNAQEIAASALFASRKTEYRLSFTEPYFLDRNIVAGIDGFMESMSQYQGSDYTLRERGGSLRFGYDLARDLFQSWDYLVKGIQIGAIDEESSVFIRNDRKKTLTSAIGHRLMFDKRDNRINPTEGYFLETNNELAGLGGNNYYFRNTVGGGIYHSFVEDWVGSLTAESGFIKGYNKKKPLQIGDKFFLGNQRLRGFAYGGVGPRDKLTEETDPLGGRAFSLVTAELTFPVGLPEELGVRGFAYTDAGILTNPGISKTTIAKLKAKYKNNSTVKFQIRDKQKIRASTGLGVKWKTPIGDIHLSGVVPWSYDKYDKKQWWCVNFGTRF
jgi:outer membrane protein insertion porin family